MASKTLTEGLKGYGIGAKLRRLRLRRSMGLVDLARHTGLSPAMLSKLERDVLFPTLPTLLRIAMVFSVGLEHFFEPEPRPLLEIVRKEDRIRLPESPGATPPAYSFESLDFPVTNRALQSYLAVFETLDPRHVRLHNHSGVEFLYMMTGTLELRVGNDLHELREGDAIYFDCTVPHGYRRLGAEPAKALVVTFKGGGGRRRSGAD